MSDQSWLNNPKLKDIDPAKLQMLLSMADQTKGKKQNELLPFLLAAASQSKSKGMSFSTEEIATIIEVLKLGKSQEEIQNMERVRSMMKLLH